MPILQQLDIMTDDNPTTEHRSMAFTETHRTWEQRAKDFDDRCAYAHKVTHQVGLLILMWIGLLAVVVSTGAVAYVGVVELCRRLRAG